MSAPSPKSSAALAAFLRGIERRGAVLAELQAGDAATGDAALAAAMQAFQPQADALPMAAWPGRFWALLLAEPGLRSRTPVAIALDATDRLGDLGSGPRAALLLRLAAGLDEVEAAAALGVAEPSYRLALQRALPHRADGQPDPEAWERLRDQIHQRIKTLPPERLVRLAQAREAALRGEPRAPEWRRDARPASASVPTRRRPRWLLPLLWSLLAACALGLAATFWWPFERWLPLGPGTQQVRVEPLAPVEPPAARYSADAGLIAHRDFALLADAAGESAAEELAFYSWYATRAGTTPAPPVPPPTDATAEADATLETVESSDAPR